jgi:hypothetical protein
VLHCHDRRMTLFGVERRSVGLAKTNASSNAKGPVFTGPFETFCIMAASRQMLSISC